MECIAVLVLAVMALGSCAIVDTAGTKASTNMEERTMNYENLPDGTYIEVAGELLPVTPVWGYFVGLKTNTRAGMLAPFTGVWTAKDGEKFVDPVRWVADLSKAVKLGTNHEQVAIWDCLNAKEVWL